MLKQIPPLQRAYQLAATGQYRDIAEVKAALVAEGYDRHTILAQLFGPTMSKSIRLACNRAKEPKKLD